MLKMLGLVLSVVLFATPALFADDLRITREISPFEVYEANKADPWGPFVMNMVLGFGVGSFFQGDVGWGGFQFVATAAGGALLLIPGSTECVQRINYECVETRTDTSEWTIVGLVLIGVGRIAGMVTPFAHANSVNEQLRQDLGISVSEIAVSEQGLALTFAVVER